MLHASMISTGEENGINIRIYGDKLGLHWEQENPNYMKVLEHSGTKKIYARGSSDLCSEARAAVRLPPGHPEGYIEAFANVYLEAFRAIRAEVAGKKIPQCDFPTIDDGIIGNAFIETVLASARSKTKWTKMK